MSDAPARPPRALLAATDFSETAAAGLDWAAELARTHRARLDLVHALHLAGPARDFVAVRPDEETAIQQAALSKLDEEAARLREGGIEVGAHLRLGLPTEAILKAAEDLRSDLLVLGARGHTGLRHLLLGSTAERVVQHATCPVLVVHPGDRDRHRPLRRLLLATDFSRDAERAAEAALALLAPGPAPRATLLHVWNLPIEFTAYGPIPTAIAYLEDHGAAAEAKLEELAAGLRARGLEVETLARQGHPAEAIVEEAKRLDADLVAMGTHGRTGLPHLFLGSTAERVVELAPCPVLTVRARDRKREGARSAAGASF